MVMVLYSGNRRVFNNESRTALLTHNVFVQRWPPTLQPKKRRALLPIRRRNHARGPLPPQEAEEGEEQGVESRTVCEYLPTWRQGYLPGERSNPTIAKHHDIRPKILKKLHPTEQSCWFYLGPKKYPRNPDKQERNVL